MKLALACAGSSGLQYLVLAYKIMVQLHSLSWMSEKACTNLSMFLVAFFMKSNTRAKRRVRTVGVKHEFERLLKKLLDKLKGM